MKVAALVSPCFLLSCACSLLLLLPAAGAQGVALAEAETQKCQERIANVQREALNHYEDGLQELQAGFQKAADLESALAVRTERKRLATEGILTEKNLVEEPKALRALQSQTVAKTQELVAQLIQESIPRLLEVKRALTVAGKLDDAVAVRTSIEQLEAGYVPITRPDARTVLPADVLLQAYAADRPRADKQYKGQKITVRGVVGGFRPDPADSKTYHIYLTSGTGAVTWIQSAFSTSEFHIHEEKQFNASILVLSTKDDPSGVRIQKGQVVEVRGTCEGWDEVVKLAKCELAH